MKRKFLTFANFAIVILVCGVIASASDSVLLQSAETDNSEENTSAVIVESSAPFAQSVDETKEKVESEQKDDDSESGDEEDDDEDEDDEDETKSRLKLSGSIYASWWDGFNRQFYDSNAWNVNQTSLSIARELDTEKYGADWGFCVDAIFGTEIAQCVDDGFDGGWGLSGDGYGASIFQCYAELGYENLSMKVGKFETELGYESFKGIDRIFNSTSYMYDYEPCTHMGVLGEWEVSERFSLSGGATMGADKSFGAKHNYGFLFGGSFDLTDKLSISYKGMFNRCVDDVCSKGNEYLHSIILGWDITERLNYTIVTNYGSLFDKNENSMKSKDYGIANYFTYQLTDKTKTGLRVEWFETEAASVSNSYVEMAFGIKYDVTEHLMFRPEIRYDWVNEVGEKSDGFSGGIGGAFMF